MPKKIVTINATDKSLGRLASEIALILQGKHKASFVPHQNQGDKVKVINVSKIKLTGNKLEQKKYYRHSGHPGGLKTIPLKKLWPENPEKVLQKTVRGMLPKNKLLSERMKNLVIVK
ncbi:MAG: 50S ribosomal protein L13 [Patescibacteria group bacterium]|nr:50S ribosomal protein L13 [Patescibacteria group bacterium]